MSAREYSDRHIGPTDDPPLLNATCYESEDGELVQFLVTIRNNKSYPGYKPGMKTGMGHVRSAIHRIAEDRGINAADAGRPPYAQYSDGKRG